PACTNTCLSCSAAPALCADAVALMPIASKLSPKRRRTAVVVVMVIPLLLILWLGARAAGLRPRLGERVQHHRWMLRLCHCPRLTGQCVREPACNCKVVRGKHPSRAITMHRCPDFDFVSGNIGIA